MIRCAKRDALRTFLQARGIATAIHYPLALHEQEAFRFLGKARHLLDFVPGRHFVVLGAAATAVPATVCRH